MQRKSPCDDSETLLHSISSRSLPRNLKNCTCINTIMSEFNKQVTIDDRKKVAVTSFKGKVWLHISDAYKGKSVSFSADSFINFIDKLDDITKIIRQCHASIREGAKNRRQKSLLYARDRGMSEEEEEDEEEDRAEKASSSKSRGRKYKKARYSLDLADTDE